MDNKVQFTENNQEVSELESYLANIINSNFLEVSDIKRILFNGGVEKFADSIEVKRLSHFNGFSGYQYYINGKFFGHILFGVQIYNGPVIYRRFQQNSEFLDKYDFFDECGNYATTCDSLSASILFLENIEMDLGCPIVSHIYGLLSYEYVQASSGVSKSKLIYAFETMLRELFYEKNNPLSGKLKLKDPAIQVIYSKNLDVEVDPVLRWKERQKVISGLSQTRGKIMKTKKRVHSFSFFTYILPVIFFNIFNYIRKFTLRPISNLRGLCYKYTVGILLWFLSTVKNNLGYSIALAIYGPFTFYFITQPMNPHAMWAVGKVRSAYLYTASTISGLLGEEVSSGPVVQAVSNKMSGNKKKAPKAKLYDKTIYTKNFSPSHMDILLSTDVPAVNEQPWPERMSNFKAMQIGYEEDMVFAARMGRLLQMETLFNFALIAESAWEEMQRYLIDIDKLLVDSSKYKRPFINFLNNEKERTYQLQLYIWDRMTRYFLDYKYIIMDDNSEQKYLGYYRGRQFIFMTEVTDVLSKRYKDLKKPKQYEKIEKLADFYSKLRRPGDNIIERLKNNSEFFNQKDIFSTDELRSYMKRQWEILYLLQSKAQEASNFGLDMYSWSVRNAVWILQSVYSAKIEELPSFAKKFNHTVNSKYVLNRKVDNLQETLFHLLNLEYVSIKKEISNRLPKDIESIQRATVIKNIQKYLVDRDKLIKN